MKLLVISHKPCWVSAESPSGYATDGGFPFQMKALSELFDATTLIVPCSKSPSKAGETPLTGHHLSIAPVREPFASGIGRKVALLLWLIINSPILLREMLRADAVHTPIPGDVGTLGMLLAFILRKPLFVRHCGNWFVQRTAAERFWKWLMEKFAGGKNIMLVTGGAVDPPSQSNPNLDWIFATSLTEEELKPCIRQRQQISSENIRLIIACRQEREKGTGVVIRSLLMIRKYFPNATLDVLGDGQALPEFKALAEVLGVREHVRFHGKVNHETVIKLLQNAELFCYPTTASEGFPKVVLEALACGLPVITTPVSVLPQLINTGCGILIKEATPEALTQAVRTCLEEPSQYSAMSQCARRTASQYSLERWREDIGNRLGKAWGTLKSNA